MKPNSSSGIRKSVLGLALGACTLAALPVAMADTYGAPYYDPVRDVMVTPRVAPNAAQSQSQSYSTPARAPIYGTYSTSSRVTAVPQSSAGIVQSSPGAVGVAYPAYPPAAAPAQPAARSAQPYYDAARDVMVTPSLSGTVPYVGSSRAYAQASATRPASTFELVVRNGRLVAGPGSIAVDHGSQVTMIVDSDAADALRVDGYNLVAPVVAGQPMLLTFVAEQPGRFAYRLGSGPEIGVIEVGPPAPSDVRVGLSQ